MNAEKLIAQVQEDGFIEFRSGCFLNTKENLQADQKDWTEHDRSKNFDFNTAPLWITTSSGNDPYPVKEAQDLQSYIDDLD